MAEYVDKQKARDLFQQKCYNVSDRINSVEVGMFVEGIMQVLDEATVADVQPVVHSKWTYGEDESGKDGIFCSNCDGFVPWDYEYYDSPDELISDNPICSHCGAKMDMPEPIKG